MKKKAYEEPRLEVLIFESGDILADSGDVPGGDYPWHIGDDDEDPPWA